MVIAKEQKMSDNEHEKKNTYNADAFLSALMPRLVHGAFPPCPCCGGREFHSGPQYTPLLVSETIGRVQLTRSMPAGTVVCKKCGHIEFFALGALGLLPVKEDQEDVSCKGKEETENV